MIKSCAICANRPGCQAWVYAVQNLPLECGEVASINMRWLAEMCARYEVKANG